MKDIHPCVVRNSSKQRSVGKKRAARKWMASFKVRDTVFGDTPEILAIAFKLRDCLASFSEYSLVLLAMEFPGLTTGVVVSRGTLFRHPFVTLFRPETTLFRRTNVTFLIFNLVIRQIIPSVGLEY